MIKFIIFFSILTFTYAEFEIIAQKKVGKNTCGACAVVQSFSFSGSKNILKLLEGKILEDKAKSFINDYGSSTSSTYKNKRNIYESHDGRWNSFI